MPKRKTIKILPWPAVKTRCFYPVRVVSVVPYKKELKVTFENLDAAQLGRMHTVHFPLPAHPDNPAGTFLRMCTDTPIEPGTELLPDQLEGRYLRVKFNNPQTQHSYKDITFKKETKNEQN